jgi:hypothetical protein
MYDFIEIEGLLLLDMFEHRRAVRRSQTEELVAPAAGGLLASTDQLIGRQTSSVAELPARGQGTDQLGRPVSA